MRLTHEQHPKCELGALVESHPLNSMLQVIVPQLKLLETSSGEASRLPGLQAGTVVATVPLGDFVRDVAASSLLNHEGDAQQSGSIAGLALGPALDRHGGVALCPDGTLHLAVSRELHEQLGIVGARSTAHAGGWGFGRPMVDPCKLGMCVGMLSALRCLLLQTSGSFAIHVLRLQQQASATTSASS